MRRQLALIVVIALCISGVYVQAIGIVAGGAAAAAAAAEQQRRTVNNGALNHSGAGMLVYENQACQLKPGAFPRVAAGSFDFSRTGGWPIWNYYAAVIQPATAACLMSATIVPTTNGYAGTQTPYTATIWFVYAPWSDIK